LAWELQASWGQHLGLLEWALPDPSVADASLRCHLQPAERSRHFLKHNQGSIV